MKQENGRRAPKVDVFASEHSLNELPPKKIQCITFYLQNDAQSYFLKMTMH